MAHLDTTLVIEKIQELIVDFFFIICISSLGKLNKTM